MRTHYASIRFHYARTRDELDVFYRSVFDIFDPVEICTRVRYVFVVRFNEKLFGRIAPVPGHANRDKRKPANALFMNNANVFGA